MSNEPTTKFHRERMERIAQLFGILSYGVAYSTRSNLLVVINTPYSVSGSEQKEIKAGDDYSALVRETLS